MNNNSIDENISSHPHRMLKTLYFLHAFACLKLIEVTMDIISSPWTQRNQVFRIRFYTFLTAYNHWNNITASKYHIAICTHTKTCKMCYHKHYPGRQSKDYHHFPLLPLGVDTVPECLPRQHWRIKQIGHHLGWLRMATHTITHLLWPEGGMPCDTDMSWTQNSRYFFQETKQLISECTGH